MKQVLNLTLSTQLKLTPQLKQSLRLLQLSSQDLEREIQQNLDTNPLLERVESDDSVSAGNDAVSDNVLQSNAEATEPSLEFEAAKHLESEQDLSVRFQEISPSPSDPQETFETHRTSSINRSESEFSQFASNPDSLFEHLSWQVRMTNLSDKDKLIADTLLRSLDSDGYLHAEIDEICALLDPELAIEEDEVTAVLSLIRTLEPIGVGARDLADRLLMLINHVEQTTNLQQYSTDKTVCAYTVARTIVKNHLDLLGTHNTSKLKKELGVSNQTLTNSLAIITQLNPRIANNFKIDSQDHIIPDVIVKKVDNIWSAQLNPDSQIKLRVNETYANMLRKNSQAALDKEGNDYIQENMAQAKVFIKGLMSRYDTLLLVSQAIVKHQQAFFEHGQEHMRPMVLQDIAKSLEMHESTISRATAGKYLLSPRGVFELKYFFSSALITTSGSASSSTAIRSLIKKMVEAEPKQKPLSDSKIAKELEQQGHIVARRTVAKYRESMHIAPSSQRKSLL